MCYDWSPCGRVLIPDVGFNDEMARNGLPQRRVHCLAGHSFYRFPVANLDRAPANMLLPGDGKGRAHNATKRR